MITVQAYKTVTYYFQQYNCLKLPFSRMFRLFHFWIFHFRFLKILHLGSILSKSDILFLSRLRMHTSFFPVIFTVFICVRILLIRLLFPYLRTASHPVRSAPAALHYRPRSARPNQSLRVYSMATYDSRHSARCPQTNPDFFRFCSFPSTRFSILHRKGSK